MDILEYSPLRFTSDQEAGYTRIRNGKGYRFLDKNGNAVKDETIKRRLKALVIPPAWKSVWISHYANGHLQATGIDEKGRKQYIYHTLWTQLREDNKFTRILEFGYKLPKLRKAIKSGLKKKKLDKAKVTAVALDIMEETLIRPGNSQYRKTYNSFGLTTLRNKHVKINGQLVFFKFVGKKGKEHQIKVSDRSLAKRLKAVMEIPGQELFQYYNEQNEICTLDSGDLNEYIKHHTADNFTSKDFRTWYGTLWAFKYLAALDAFQSKATCKRNINECLDFVAKKLGNTRTVCRQYYVCIDLLKAYEENTLQPYLAQMNRSKSKLNEDLKAEKFLIKFLKEIKLS
jgi:DNA topoisomerase I